MISLILDIQLGSATRIPNRADFTELEIRGYRLNQDEAGE